MAALLEDGRSLGANQHGPLILAHQRGRGLRFNFSQTLTLPLQVQFLKLLGRIDWQVATRGLPESCIIQHRERRDRCDAALRKFHLPMCLSGALRGGHGGRVGGDTIDQGGPRSWLLRSHDATALTR